MIKFKREDHPDVAGGWAWSSNEINWINQEIEAAVLAEREACARLVEADGLARGADGYMLIKAATRIRARGET